GNPNMKKGTPFTCRAAATLSAPVCQHSTAVSKLNCWSRCKASPAFGAYTTSPRAAEITCTSACAVGASQHMTRIGALFRGIAWQSLKCGKPRGRAAQGLAAKYLV